MEQEIKIKYYGNTVALEDGDTILEMHYADPSEASTTYHEIAKQVRRTVARVLP